MFKLNLHARIELALAATLLLGSCSGDGPRLYTHDEIADIAADAAADVAAEQVSELESRVVEIKSRLDI